MNKNQRTQMQEKQANALALAAGYYKDDLMQISIRLKAFRFHEKALRGEVFYDRRNALACFYRLDHNRDDLFLEAKKIGNMILILNTNAKHDPDIGSYFLGRRYNIKEMPNPLSASNDEIAAYFHDVYEILDDFEDMLYSAEIFAKENGK